MSRIFANPDQIEEWVEVAEGMTKRFGTEKALDYLIGGKFYDLVAILHSARKIMRTIEEERKKPDFNPVQVTKYHDRELKTNLDQTYDDEGANALEAEELIVKFVLLVRGAFADHDIRRYFHSDPQLGLQISTKEEHEFLVKYGAMEHTIDTEVEDALILGDMMKYFGIKA